MTALSLAYPLIAGLYFWQDWGRYVGSERPQYIGASGFAVPVNDQLMTVLSPWRVLMAMITAKVLFTSARKLRQGAGDGKALSLLALFGLVLPQTAWGLEFVNDWRGGEGAPAVAALALAATALPAALISRGGGALEGWGKLSGAPARRALGAAVGLGWMAMAAMSLADHSYQLRNAGGAIGAALATLPLAALAMIGLFRQRTWGMLAGGAAAAAAGASVAALSGATILPTGTSMDAAFATLASAPVLGAAIPAVALALLLRPFVRGAARKLAGTDESTGVRVASDVHTASAVSAASAADVADEEREAGEEREASEDVEASQRARVHVGHE